MTINIEMVLLVLSVLFFISILAGKASSKFGVPALLLFLGVGMLFGSDGLGIQFEDIQIAQAIGTVALCIILFSGGLDTNINEIRPVIWQGIVLATVGVFLTAAITGVLIWWVLGMTAESAGISLITSLLLASTMASTDSASVFSILRSKGLNLKNNLRPMLELESGSNDPMAYVLVITLIGIITQVGEPDYFLAAVNLVMQLVIGGLSGFVLGKLAVKVINRISIGNNSLYPILALTICIFIFSSTTFIKGNGFLAVYIGGLVIGNSRFVQKRSSLNFFDGLAWLSQLVLFLSLGLLVNPHELIPMLIPGLIISFLMIFVSRPLSVFLSLLPFRKMGVKDKVYVSWVGLRGAVPIIFAVFPLVEDVPHARLIFNIVFLCTLISLLVQGTSLAIVAKWLNLAKEPDKIKELESFDIDFSSDIKSVTTEIEINENTLMDGKKLIDLPLPDDILVVMIKRGDKYFVPNGKTILQNKDKILILADDNETIVEAHKRIGDENF